MASDYDFEGLTLTKVSTDTVVVLNYDEHKL